MRFGGRNWNGLEVELAEALNDVDMLLSDADVNEVEGAETPGSDFNVGGPSKLAIL